MTFEEAVEFVLRWEGGDSDHADDPGGRTRFGISQRAYPDLDIANLTREDAIEIYRRDYFERSGADRLEPRLALVHFDASVQHGVGRANQFLAQTSDPLHYIGLRLEFYTRLDNWPSFGRGWTRRMADLSATVAAMQPTDNDDWRIIVYDADNEIAANVTIAAGATILTRVDPEHRRVHVRPDD